MATARRPRWLLLDEGERVVRVSGANRTAGRTAAGGWLAMTTERLVHHTHVFERSTTGTGDWEVPSVITAVTERRAGT